MRDNTNNNQNAIMSKCCFQFASCLLIYGLSNKMLNLNSLYFRIKEISIKGREISEAADSKDLNQENFFLFAKTSSTLTTPFLNRIIWGLL